MALVFSCLAGVLGVAVVAWYGMGELEGRETGGKVRVGMGTGMDGVIVVSGGGGGGEESSSSGDAEGERKAR